MIMGRRKLNQAGITIFETSVIVLLLLMITISTILMIKKINQTSQNNTKKVQDTNSLTGGHQ
jgi:Tfp pilus assembly protein PilV